MSNPQPQGAQGAPQQQTQQQQQQQPQLLKPEDVSKLRFPADDQRAKYRQALQGYWNIMNSSPSDSVQHTQAKGKLAEWSQKLIQQEKNFRARQMQQQPQQQQQQGQPGQRPNPQAPSGTQQPGIAQQPPSQPAPQAQAPNQQPSAQTRPQMQSQQQTQPPNQMPAHAPQQNNNQPQGAHAQPQHTPEQKKMEIEKHVSSFPYRMPANFVHGTAEAFNKYRELRASYLKGLMAQENGSSRVSHVDEQMRKLRESGQEAPQQMIHQRQQALAAHAAAKRYVDDFRKSQKALESQGLPVYHPPQQPVPPSQPPNAAQATSVQQNNTPQHAAQGIIAPDPAVKVEGSQGPPPTPQFQNTQMPPTSLPQAPRPPPSAHSQPMQHPNQAQFGQPQPGQPQPPRPQLNQQQPNPHMQQQHSNSPHPQSATSSGPAGPPVPLSHHAAVSAAQRQYSDPQRTNSPMQPGGNFNMGGREREHINNPKLPIPRTLNTTAPVPVNMGHARPTMSGPSNGAPGPMGQPVINKFPSFQLEGEGDRVLSKRKLDELVRQVTGGSEDSLTPEVESAMLQLADDFVDTVIMQACKLAKLRDSPNLEIRDLQLILERNYNVRIPGYSSDEVRTVRKVVPSAGWTQKMNLVQASKVMGGKND